MKEKLKLVAVTKNDIKKALAENTYWQESKYIPFSKSKAAWLLRNDRIDDNDVCAILGLEGQILVSFIFMIPDIIRTENGLRKIYWSLRWWVIDKHKDTILPTYTRKKSLKAINNQIIVRYLGEEVEAFYEKQPFTKVGSRRRFFIVFSLDANLILLKKPTLHFLKPILKFFEKLSFKTIQILNKRIASKKKGVYTYQYLEELDNETWEFLKQHTIDDIVPKTMEYVNWQIDNTQYENIESNSQKHICLVGSISNKIGNTSLSILVKGTVVGFLSYYINGSEFIVRYFVFDNDFRSICVDALMENFIKSNSIVLQTENDFLGQEIKKRYHKIFSREKNIVSLVHNDLNINALTIRDHDGQFA
ncbi:hypothetical protein ABN763_01755 [Spongiivirga sp. MCCC 1A20706]|uniref:hypothetical protein n=1 Tax=Spongiivirga sp. MCCC 1A20706 TaxID=3160963 RepID=UPI003977373B